MSEAQELKWQVRLSDRQPQKLRMLYVFLVLAALIGYMSLRSPLGSIVAVLMIFGATADFILPQHFSLNGTEATRRCGISVTSIPWSAIKRMYETDNGVKLTPLENDSRLEPFRGVQLIYENNRDQVLAAIKEFSEQDVRILER